MTTETRPTAAELIEKIRDAIAKLDTCGIVDLGHFAFDRIPCSRRTLYAVARKHAQGWGYVYHAAEYVPSGNRPFQRNHKRGRHDKPSLVKTTARQGA